ncbi:recombinase family protein [Bacillus sp. ISL-47]|uniref:recombinase family protein n=1 Tax=Bacillus sp. ISL-47 TaxID=2819130 RepID=UPI001BE8198A|nr:recombinase family protein [Bacillus sp. ISL-47]MBT2687275.1 recombinase family protein [Bacillus sp. ISL-47]MBT2706655.1 recombinase family protein [Pseudomonas sp. ISL-84]
MKKTKALVYVRVSTDKQADNTSIPKQIEELEEYCDAHGFDIVCAYKEEASAKDIDGREEFKKMYKYYMENEDIEYMIVFKLDRLFRNFLDSIFFWDQIKRANKHFISLTDNINTKDPNAKMMFLVNALKADMEREDIAFRTNFGMEKKAAAGYFNGGKVFGYESVSKRLRVIPEEAAVIEYIFNKYVYEQWGYKKIASNLNLQGFKTKRNNDWTINAVKTILENKIYIGFIKWRNEYTKGQHEPIISKELWNKAQELKAKKSYTPTKVHPGTFPLSGLLKCPQCGSSMVQGNSSEKYKYYQCNKNKNSGRKACSANLISKEYADEAVLANLITYLDKLNLSSLLFTIIKSNLESNLKSLGDEVNLLNKSLKSIREKIKNAADLFLGNDNDSNQNNNSTFYYLIGEYEKEEEDTLSRLNKLSKEINLQNNLNIKNNIEYVANHLKDFINIISEEEKKLLFHSIIKEVHVTNGPKPKDRLIKNVIFHFTEDEFNEYGLSLRHASC